MNQQQLINSQKHISSKCECKFAGEKCNSDQKIWKNIILFGNLLHVVAKMVNI